MALIEESDDLVALLEAGYGLADCLDDAGAIGAGNDVVGGGEGVGALGDDEIPVVEGGTVHCGGKELVEALRDE